MSLQSKYLLITYTTAGGWSRGTLDPHPLQLPAAESILLANQPHASRAATPASAAGPAAALSDAGAGVTAAVGDGEHGHTAALFQLEAAASDGQAGEVMEEDTASGANVLVIPGKEGLARLMAI